MSFPSFMSSRFQFVSTALVIFSLLSGIHALYADTPPNITECETVKLSWAGAHSPFTLHILFSQNNSLLQEFVNVANNSVFWEAAVPAGTELHLEVLDSNSADDSPGLSGNFTVLPGNDSCLQPSSTTSSTATATSSSSTMQPSDTGAAATPPSRKPASATALSPGAVAGIAVACFAAGFLAALAIWLVWLVRRRSKASKARAARIPDRPQLDDYDPQKRRQSEDADAWSATTPRNADADADADADEQPRADPGSWDAHLLVRTPPPPPPSLRTHTDPGCTGVTNRAVHLAARVQAGAHSEGTWGVGEAC